MLEPSLLPGIGRLLKSDCLQDLMDHGSRLGLGGSLRQHKANHKEPRNLVETACVETAFVEAAFVEAVKQAAEISLPLLSTQVECRLPKRLRISLSTVCASQQPLASV